jgi:hypothetical protein
MQTIKSLVLLGLLSLGLIPVTAQAFAEDVCFIEGGGLKNCVETRCRVGDSSARCEWEAALGTVVGNLTSVGGRSSVHVDATYYLALAVGFGSSTAYTIAAYNQATDLAQYVPYDIQGRPLVDPSTCTGSAPPAACSLVTANIDGVTRMNFSSGGFLMHFVVPDKRFSTSVNGLNPDLQSANSAERHLKSLRAWAFEGPAACVAGLLLPGTTTSACESPSLSVVGQVPLINFSPALPMNAPLGQQPLQTPARQPPVLVSSLALVVGSTNARAARIGIYLHSLQDRISHRVCGDASTYRPPQSAGANYAVELHPTECNQTNHALRHSWEAGTVQSQVPTQHRTLQPALEKTYDELLALAVQFGSARPEALQPTYRQQVLQIALSALEQPQASTRVLQMRNSMLAFRSYLVPMYGH